MKLNLTAYEADIQETVISPMLDFMAELDGEDYTEADVEDCRALLMDYLRALNALESPDDAAILAQVEAVVLALNDLNERTDYAMIETGEREALCEIIQRAAEESGLQDIPEDVTEDWREW